MVLWMSAQGISSCLRRPGHQDSKNDRHEEERRHICNQVAAFSRIIEGLNSHDRAVNHARPHGKPDDALVRVGISGCDKQKYAQCRIHSDDHQQIVRMSVPPSPARGPHNAQCIYAERFASDILAPSPYRFGSNLDAKSRPERLCRKLDLLLRYL